ncbi:hypothetical protein [Streptomyces sp. MNP-20]|uniref:hypothetical protein n=1 Tax=Streptomyces sp. MNP-20 TaxID=2721165 RepID=UPI0015522653|nr:hypothetical protein [Streptomyces sp. MNP-20]
MRKDVMKIRRLLSPADPARSIAEVPAHVDERITRMENQVVRRPRVDRARRRRLAAGVVAAAASVAVTVVVVRTSDGGDEPPKAGGVVVGQGKDRLPSDTATDWVSYADHVAVVRLAKDSEVPPSAEEERAGEGMIVREGTLTVERVLWSREQAPALPGQVTMDLAGWVFKGDSRREFAGEGSPRVEPGRTYIMALARYSPDEWGPLGSDATLPYENGTIGKGESQGTPRTPGQRTDELSTLEREVDGDSGAALTAILRGTRPDPLAEKYAGLPPEERFEKVEEVQNAGQDEPDPDDGVDTGTVDGEGDDVPED